MASGDNKKLPKTSTGRSNIRSLADLNSSSGSNANDGSDDPPEYYTGGEKSGMLVQDPKGKPDVDEIFNQARQFGAIEGLPEHLRPSSSLRSFTGTGRLLSGETIQSSPQQPESILHTIVFWHNGFTVNDGPLRRLDDPENASFLESIKNSECPKELEPSNKASVHVNLIRRDENFPEPERRHIPFQGLGRTLGGGSTVGTSSPQSTAVASKTGFPDPVGELFVDNSFPTTSIQLRLADGTRMVAHFNYHHTVNDIRAFIDSSRPGGTRTYELQTVGFPPKKLTNPSQSIEEAGLANSVIIQKL